MHWRRFVRHLGRHVWRSAMKLFKRNPDMDLIGLPVERLLVRKIAEYTTEDCPVGHWLDCQCERGSNGERIYHGQPERKCPACERVINAWYGGELVSTDAYLYGPRKMHICARCNCVMLAPAVKAVKARKAVAR